MNLLKLRGHTGYIAFFVHRISGLCLALFLPVHLYMLSLLLQDPARFDQFLAWTNAPRIKFSEAVLIALAAAHLAGGLRILAIEYFALPYQHGWVVAAVAAFAVVAGVLFLTSASL